MTKQRVLLIKTGGTIAQKPDEKGVLYPSTDEYLNKIEGINELAHIETVDLGSIDSTNMETVADTPTIDRKTIAETIYKRANDFDGFVVIHGTDTLSETAAALTYMIQELGKPIVLTGAQRSIWVPSNDASNNVYLEVKTAISDFGEVAVTFGDYILRGARVRKTHEEAFNAFETPRLQPLGSRTALPELLKLENHRITRGNINPHLFTDFDTRVFHYEPISGAHIETLLYDSVDYECVAGYVLGSFGAGNIPDRLHEFIKKATDAHKPVILYTKCDTGAAHSGLYSVGLASLESGAESAGDMTLEALGQKMMYALGMLRVFRSKGIRYVEDEKDYLDLPDLLPLTLRLNMMPRHYTDLRRERNKLSQRLLALAEDDPAHFVYSLIRTPIGHDITDTRPEYNTPS